MRTEQKNTEQTDLYWVVGAGGHAKVVMDAWSQRCLLLNPLCATDAACFADDNPALWGKMLMGYRIEGPVSRVLGVGHYFHVAIGHNGARRALYRQLQGRGVQPYNVIHPSASVSVHSQLGRGIFVAAGAVLAAQAAVADCVIINHAAVVDHDCSIAAFAHIAPHATLGGNVHVGEGALIGAGATVLPGLYVGARAVVAAGAVVVQSVADDELVCGVPAKRMRPKTLPTQA
jgi:sugar O-acyltransferase (sialic acid O-acetyltransferase NeuD family)